MDRNPFSRDIVKEPRDIDSTISGLNEKPLKSMIAQFMILAKQPLPRTNIYLDHIQFVTSVEAGYGKSHLIGRLFFALSGRATLVYIRPFHDPGTFWKSILVRIVQELNTPDHLGGKTVGPMQLEAFSHGVLAHLGAITIEKRRKPSQNRDRLISRLRRSSVDKFVKNENNILWMKKNFSLLVENFPAAFPAPLASVSSWLNVLFHFAYSKSRGETRQACLDWLKGGPISMAEAQSIGVRPADIPHPESEAAELNEICKNRIKDLCLLAGFFRPFVFCFDETESYKAEKSLAGTLGIALTTLLKEMPNHMTVVTANIEPWMNSIAPNWEQAQLDCLRKPPLELEFIDIHQGSELIKNRLEYWRIKKKDAARVLDRQWLENDVFIKREGIGIRDFLKICAERFSADPEPTRILPLGELYAKYVEEIKAQTKRHVFDRDALRWLVEVLAKKIAGLTVEIHQARKPYLVLKWIKPDGTPIFFGFEDGSNHARWKAITAEAQRYHQAHPKAVSVFFRTPELAEIPGKKWKIAPAIEQAKKEYLHLFILGPDLLARLYAARDLHSAAMEGDITGHGPDDILSFLARELQDFWEKVGIPGGPPASCPAPAIELIDEIRTIVKREKMMDFISLKKGLNDGETLDDGTIRLGIDEIPQIKSFAAGPHETVLLWRP